MTSLDSHYLTGKDNTDENISNKNTNVNQNSLKTLLDMHVFKMNYLNTFHNSFSWKIRCGYHFTNFLYLCY